MSRQSNPVRNRRKLGIARTAEFAMMTSRRWVALQNCGDARLTPRIQHTRGKRHRRFALEASNWYELDNLLAVIGRPVVPELLELYAAAKVEPPSDIDCSEGDSDEDSDSEIEAASSESLSTSNAAMNDSGFEDQIARVHDLKRKIAAITGSDSSSSDSDSEEDSEEAPTEDDEDSDEVEDV